MQRIPPYDGYNISTQQISFPDNSQQKTYPYHGKGQYHQQIISKSGYPNNIYTTSPLNSKIQNEQITVNVNYPIKFMDNIISKLCLKLDI